MRLGGILHTFYCRCLKALGVLLMPMLLGASEPTEYDVKLVYLYNFSKFIKWPSDAFTTADSDLEICVLGSLPEEQQDLSFTGKTSGTHPIKLILLAQPNDESACQILFVTRAYVQANPQAWIQKLKHYTLLVGETADFAKHYGVIGFVMDNQNHIHIEINLASAARRQLNIRAQLLEIASAIYKDEG